MNLTSFTRYLKTDAAKPADYIRFLQLLLQGISLHVIEGEPEDVNMLRCEVHSVSAAIMERSTRDDLLVGITTVIHSLQSYVHRTSRVVKAHVEEFRNVLPMMTKTIEFLTHSQNKEVEQLKRIEKNLIAASDLEDVRVLRLRMAECLELVREEGRRVDDECRKKAEALSAEMRGAARRMQAAVIAREEKIGEMPGERATASLSRSTVRDDSAWDLDSVTGLGGRKTAECTITAAIDRGAECGIAVCLVDRLASINIRYGRKIGDQALLIAAQHLAQLTTEPNSVTRWSGPAFALTDPLPAGWADFERRVRGIGGTRFELTATDKGRSFRLTITLSSALFRVGRGDPVSGTFQRMDAFVASHAAEAVSS